MLDFWVLIFYIIEIIVEKLMNDLSRKEKLVIGTIWEMKDKPYGLNIRRNLFQLTGRPWSIGTLYFRLDRLEKRGILKSYPTHASQDRGNSRKRLYDFTKEGSEQLMDLLAQEQNREET